MGRTWWVVLGMAVAACGGGSGSTPDAAPPDSDGARPAVCGNGIVETGEQCDDGNTDDDDFCAGCAFTCGDGVVGEDETCDSGIAAGMPGACPADCDDDNVCTTDALAGQDCLARCVHGDITAPIDGDSCCPVGANVANDDDCPAGCGNGVVEAGETCDTGIAAGMPGACPTACDDGQACTSDELVVPAACQNACTYTPITATTGGDGCCPAGADSTTDTDCSASCGNGVADVDAGETCDTAIAAGDPGACPTACDDGDACTTDQLLSAGTCSAACSAPPITAPADGDLCCPPGAHADTDADCVPMCGNGVIEAGEQCDPPGADCDANCLFPPTAFRLMDMDLKDPHIYLDTTCGDITPAVNFLLGQGLAEDDDGNGYLDLNVVAVFRPLDQAAASTDMDVDLGAVCTAPPETTECTSAGTDRVSSTATNLATGVCLEPIAGTTNPSYLPAIVDATGPCFASDSETLDVDLGTIVITLQDARIAGRYVGVPATQLVDGFILGFISEAQAEATVFPDDLPFVGGKTLSQLLTGGTGGCTLPDGSDDRDLGPDGTTLGWYFYLNYTAETKPYTLTL